MHNMSKQRQTAVSVLLSDGGPNGDAKETPGLRRRARSSLEVVRAPRSFSYITEDPLHPGMQAYKVPEKWYSLSQHSAQAGASVIRNREQTHKPVNPTRPSENPYSAPPSRINHFHDICPNPRLVEDKRKKKRRGDHEKAKDHEGGGDSRSPPKAGVPMFGYMRKCNNPFTEGWKIATFKPAREKLVPYICKVRKFWKDRGYGFLDYRGQEVFVHVNDIKVQGGILAEDSKVVCEIYPHSRRGLEARNVRLADAADTVVKPPGMPEQEYDEILSRRKYDEELKTLFGTGFWRYPKSEETVSPEKGGQGFDYIPFEKSVSMERKTVISNPLSEDTAAKQKPPTLKVERGGPSLEGKLSRRPWLSKFLLESPARHPQGLPECHSYFTSPVVSSLERTRHPRHRYDVHEAALSGPSPLRSQTLALRGPPKPHASLRAESHSPMGMMTSIPPHRGLSSGMGREVSMEFSGEDRDY